MSNIWEALFFTIDLTLWAGLILIIKRIFKGRLSPTWQSNIWGVLVIKTAITLFFGVNYFEGSFIINKAIMWVESFLDSSYSGVYQSFSFTEFTFAMPTSVTDWLFIIYVLGVIFTAIYYISQYIKLRSFINKNAIEIDNADLQAIKIGEVNNLKSCKIVYVEGIKAPFLCGIIKPVIVLPKDLEINYKVILHELIHLKYKHNLQNMFWCFLRSLNWCNPILRGILNDVSNDIEIFCDQKVLEKLEGEELREYGKTLLSMADERYSKVVGTTSISNGDENIKRRISSLVRFKKYPKDLKIVTYCINAILLFLICITSAVSTIAFTVSAKDYSATNMAIVQAYEARTMLSAIEIYAKGLVSLNFNLLAIVAPEENVKDIIDSSIAFNEANCPQDVSYFISDACDDNIEKCLSLELFEGKYDMNYVIYNLNETEEKSAYEGTLLIELSNFDIYDYWYDVDFDTAYQTMSTGIIIIPFEVYKEDSGRWVFNQTGEYDIVRIIDDNSYFDVTPLDYPYTEIQSMYLDWYENERYTNLYECYLEQEVALTYEHELGSGYLSQYTILYPSSCSLSEINTYAYFENYRYSCDAGFEFNQEIGDEYPYTATITVYTEDGSSSSSSRTSLESAEDNIYNGGGGGFSMAGSTYDSITTSGGEKYDNVIITITNKYREVVAEMNFKEDEQ